VPLQLEGLQLKVIQLKKEILRACVIKDLVLAFYDFVKQLVFQII
jgi:hypothetical protein